MIDREEGIVDKIIYEDKDIQEILVIIKNRKFKAMNFISLSGKCKIGDTVLLNTTAIKLKLGTGGYHYVITNLDDCEKIQEKKGHIMKLRYTPLQIAIQTMEEQESPYHDAIKNFKSLQGMPVIVGSLHSMLAPVAALLKYYNPHLKITYIMSDGSSLPISISKSVRELKMKKLIDNTITFGHAFGGDYEAVNIYTALIGAKEITKCDIAIVTMGPGIVGTATEYGFTGIEQASIIDAVNTLQGDSIAIPRISFADKRKRHYGLSHHSITIFSKLIKTSTTISFPRLKDEVKMNIIKDKIIENNLNEKHNIQYRNTEELEKILEYFDIKVSTMARNYFQDSEFFQSAASAGKIALEKLKERMNL
ncbi:DUF3866 family protein [Garciella nitratireducens]|uniref:DUF3866 family protein n=1 Tax=Garciella nitratireducens TaxID=218205 RepID=UPI000DEA72BD|nr:DUF3866 family protein [Garciella nitratireducens]RBP45571.1 uncharacterized protein DUF3866 [Garciella nitratireducens]